MIWPKMKFYNSSGSNKQQTLAASGFLLLKPECQATREAALARWRFGHTPAVASTAGKPATLRGAL